MNTQPQLDQLYSSVWRLFLTAHKRLSDQIEQQLAQAELPPLEWYDVLLSLKEAPNHQLRLSELADKTLLSRSNLTRLVDRLEQAKLLCRKSCPSDRRGTYAALTPAGLSMQEQMWSVYAAGIVEYFAAHVSESEAKTLQQVLQRLLAAAETRVDP